MSYFTAQRQMEGVKERLGLSWAGPVYSDVLDADSFPILRIFNHAEYCYLAIHFDVASGNVDAFGLPQRQYSPHIAVLVMDAAASADNQIHLVAQAGKLGMKVEVWTGVGAGAATDYATAKALCTKVATLPANEIFGMTLSQ